MSRKYRDDVVEEYRFTTPNGQKPTSEVEDSSISPFRYFWTLIRRYRGVGVIVGPLLSETRSTLHLHIAS